MRKRTVIVNDKMQKGYRYQLTEQAGRNFDPEFIPQVTPKEMLRLGVFCGKYMTDTRKEFPKSWFESAKLTKNGRDPSLNYFGVDASQPLAIWRKNGWIHPDDPRGWFQWYCRYVGRRMPSRKPFGRLGGGRQCEDTLGRSNVTASRETRPAANGKDRLFFAGPTTVGNFEAVTAR